VLCVGLLSNAFFVEKEAYRRSCAEEQEITLIPNLLDTSLNFSKKIEISEVNADT